MIKKKNTTLYLREQKRNGASFVVYFHILPLPDFSGTDEFFVCVTLNGLIIDKTMLFVIHRISENCGALLSTTDFLTIDALYHERPLTEKMKSRLNHLIEMGIVEHIG